MQLFLHINLSFNLIPPTSYIVNNTANIVKILRKYIFFEKKLVFLVLNNINLYICGRISYSDS